ncbi:uncharacterized protein LOC128245316 [Mya arenaria]|uniref:uncharacterized protein LOC128245316 n=1 Tax=Mya arenaria TaxID=6604 RepID=UPI0022E23EE5|nr:uncharacterized protein LOC128245316 [Mya arenaria]
MIGILNMANSNSSIEQWTRTVDKKLGNLETQIKEINKNVEILLKTVKAPKPRTRRSNTRKPLDFPDLDIRQLQHLQEAIKVNLCAFVDNLTLEGGEVLDRLVEESCINDEEYHSIRARSTPKDKCRLLMVKIKNKAPHVIQKFLKVLEDEPVNAHIVQKVNESLEQITKTKATRKCLICIMKATVDIKDIADELLSKEMIQDELYEEIVQAESPQNLRPHFWECIIEHIKGSSDQRNDIKVLIECLKKQYSHIASCLTDVECHTVLQCCFCTYRRRNKGKRLRESYFENETDASATSERSEFSDSESLQSSYYGYHEEEEVTMRPKERRSADRKKKIQEFNTFLKNDYNPNEMLKDAEETDVKQTASRKSRVVFYDIKEVNDEKTSPTHETSVTRPFIQVQHEQVQEKDQSERVIYDGQAKGAQYRENTTQTSIEGLHHEIDDKCSQSDDISQNGPRAMSYKDTSAKLEKHSVRDVKYDSNASAKNAYVNTSIPYLDFRFGKRRDDKDYNGSTKATSILGANKISSDSESKVRTMISLFTEKASKHS